jgi:hypothetical protein
MAVEDSSLVMILMTPFKLVLKIFWDNKRPARTEAAA